MNSFSISFGCLSDPLKKQLADQGLKMAPQPLRSLSLRMREVAGLFATGFLSEAESHRVHQRLMKEIRREVEKRMARRP